MGDRCGTHNEKETDETKMDQFGQRNGWSYLHKTYKENGGGSIRFDFFFFGKVNAKKLFTILHEFFFVIRFDCFISGFQVSNIQGIFSTRDL